MLRTNRNVFKLGCSLDMGKVCGPQIARISGIFGIVETGLLGLMATTSIPMVTSIYHSERD